jgi:Ca-activated chloride channel family protein
MSHTVRSGFAGRRLGVSVLGVIAVMVLAAAVAISPGWIAGSVRDQAGAPISNAQVFVVGTSLTALSDSAGKYRIDGVPAGTQAVRGAFIGYKSMEVRDVVVRDGKGTTVDLTLEQTAVEIQEITVTSHTQPLVPRDDARIAQERNPRDVTPSAGYRGDAFPGMDGLMLSPSFTESSSAPAPAGAVAPAGAATAKTSAPSPAPVFPREMNTENYAAVAESRFLPAADNPRSTFSIDVDAASYTNVRRFLTSGQRPPRDAVRVEEFLNYFRYDYPEPRGKDRFSVTTDVAVAPWAPEHRLLRVGIKGKSLKAAAVPPTNLVFLIDVSGSMRPENKLPLVKESFRLLVNELREQDRVAIVVYAGAAGLVLPPTPGCDKATILAALDQLEAGGSTAGGAGLRLAYDVARQSYARGSNNRVILATDGDFNVGESSDAAMVQLIEERRDQGIFLTVLGFGTGNLKDSRMEQIADKGNGHYAYVDNLQEGRRVFVREFAGTLMTLAKDVKIQVEFNPAKVQAYRLIGYENRALKNEDFADDRKDAGELGAGHTVTALYEIVPVGVPFALAGDSLRYQTISLRSDTKRDEWLTVQLRYKEPDGTTSRLQTHPVRVRGRVGEPEGDFRFATAVAGFGMVLRNSEYRGAATLDQVLHLARSAESEDPDGERAEFVRLVESARTLILADVGDGQDWFEGVPQ